MEKHFDLSFQYFPAVAVLLGDDAAAVVIIILFVVVVTAGLAHRI